MNALLFHGENRPGVSLRRGSWAQRCRSNFLIAAVVFLSFGLFFSVAAQSSPDSREQLRSDLDRLSQEIDVLRVALRETRTQQRSLAQEIQKFDQEIRRTELAAARAEREILEIQENIRDIEKELMVYEERIGEAQRNIASLLRDVAERDAASTAAWLFSGRTLSDLADQIAAGDRVEQEILNEIESLRFIEADLEEKKRNLQERRGGEEVARLLLIIERDDLQVKRALRTQVLTETRGREQDFAVRLSGEERNAARIREQLYLLADSGRSLSLGEAHSIARPVADAVGIRTSFLLAVLQKESRLGALVGSGYWRVDMHPRDWAAFLQITQELNLDPDKTSVSRKPSYGWGGAMGPAQFLPSVWLAYRDRIAAMTLHDPPSPWDIHDAFAAAALKLAASGAGEKTPEAEWRAAMQYFAGGNWRNPAYAFYGDAVEDLAASFQEQINILES